MKAPPLVNLKLERPRLHPDASAFRARFQEEANEMYVLTSGAEPPGVELATA